MWESHCYNQRVSNVYFFLAQMAKCQHNMAPELLFSIHLVDVNIQVSMRVLPMVEISNEEAWTPALPLGRLTRPRPHWTVT